MRNHFWRRIIAISTALWLALALPTSAWAHPLGNFTINHYAGLHVTQQEITVDYVLDMAEIPAFQEIALSDANGNGQPDAAESGTYHSAKCESIRSDLNLSVNSQSSALTLSSSTIEFPQGAGGLLTLRLNCIFSTSLTDEATNISFTDNLYPDRIGWREIVVTSDQVALQGDFASTSISDRLTKYPADLMSNPLDQRAVSFGMDATLPSQAQGELVPAQEASSSAVGSNLAFGNGRQDAFTQLITMEDLSLPAILFALVISFVWGAMHALTPGHGKAVVGSYLIGERGNARHALLLGLTTTITHTAGVFAMGLVTLLAAQFITPEQLFPWLSFLSGALVAGIGIRLVITRLREARAAQSAPRFEVAPVQKRSFVRQAAPHAHHDDSHQHGHGHPHDHDHHGHEDHTHSHLPPETVTWRSIVALGISGGILPCPSALIVLLSAIALGRIGLGLALVLAFSLGLAGVLTAIGLLFVYAGRMISFAPKQKWILRVLPVASALVISLAGLGIAAQALTQIGWISL
jgi:nickel/cobalt transporter (NicO) family protein